MAKTKIYKDTWARTPNAFYVSAMRTTDDRNSGIESANQQWQQATALFHTTFQTLDDAYQRSMVSFATQSIAEKDEERDPESLGARMPSSFSLPLRPATLKIPQKP